MFFFSCCEQEGCFLLWRLGIYRHPYKMNIKYGTVYVHTTSIHTANFIHSLRNVRNRRRKLLYSRQISWSKEKLIKFNNYLSKFSGSSSGTRTATNFFQNTPKHFLLHFLLLLALLSRNIPSFILNLHCKISAPTEIRNGSPATPFPTILCWDISSFTFA